MVPAKSHIDFIVNLASSLLSCDPLGLCKSDLRKDLEVLTSRVASEGLSFLTKAMPGLGKALDQALVEGRLNVPRGFRLEAGTTSRPAFMQAYFRRLFDEQGNLLEETDPLVVKHLRQCLFFAYKYELPYKKADTQKVIDSFLKNEADLAHLVFEDESVVNAAAYLVRDVLEGFDPKDIVPRHGPGSVATGERGDGKWAFKRLYRSAHQMYPYYDYFMVGRGRELSDRDGWYEGLRREDHGVAKVVLVPKDSRGPRLISCEPLELQYLQQGIMRKLVPHIESHSRTRGAVNFTNQEVNRKLALESSLTGRFVTLDLKDASDLVSMQLVERVFAHTPQMLAAIKAVRSAATTLPDGREVTLLKHAPMGSALCFPIMALTCWAVITAAIARATRSYDTRNIGKSVKIFGDDIIVPTEWAQISIQALTGVGLKVNTAKSCTAGFFRESCGMDAFRGVSVTPVRLRTLWTGRQTDGNAYTSYIETANNLFAAGYEDASLLIQERLRAVYGRIPYGTETAPYPAIKVRDPLVAVFLNARHFRMRWNADCQKIEFLLKKVKSRKVLTTLDDWPRLIRDLVASPGDDPDNVVLPRSTQIKRGWASV